MQQRHDPGEHAPRERLDRHPARHIAVDLHDVRLQPPDAVEIRVAGAEIVDHDEAAQIAVVIDRGGEAPLVLERRLDQLHGHPVGGETVFLQHLRKRTEPAALDRDERVDVEKEPAVLIAQALEVPDVERSALAVELHARHPRRRLCEELGRQVELSARIGPADQPLVAHGPTMGKAENRLEMAGQAEFGARATLSLDE